MAENYPGTRLTSNDLKLRFEGLKSYTIEQVAGAATKLFREHRFSSMPTVGDFIQAIDSGGGLTPEQWAEIEAGKILDHLHRHGATREPKMENPVARHLMTNRWRYRSWAAKVQESDLKWWRWDFIRAYLAHQAGTVRGVSLPWANLPGISGKLRTCRWCTE